MSSPSATPSRIAEFPDDGPPILDRILRAVSLTGFGILLFPGGVAVSIFGVFPAPLLQDAYNGGTALYAKWTQYQDITQTDLWMPARTDARGVTIDRKSTRLNSRN